MPSRDVYHDVVKRALEKDGWHISADPYHLGWGRRDLYVDFGAEVIAAEKDGKQITLAIKSFLGRSEVSELERSVGQFIMYRTLLLRKEPERLLYLAVPNKILVNVFEDSMGKLLIEDAHVRVVGYDPAREEVTRWLPGQP